MTARNLFGSSFVAIKQRLRVRRSRRRGVLVHGAAGQRRRSGDRRRRRRGTQRGRLQRADSERHLPEHGDRGAPTSSQQDCCFCKSPVRMRVVGLHDQGP